MQTSSHDSSNLSTCRQESSSLVVHSEPVFDFSPANTPVRMAWKEVKPEGRGGGLLREKGSKAAPKLVLFGVSSTAVAGIWVLTFYLKPGNLLYRSKIAE